MASSVSTADDGFVSSFAAAVREALHAVADPERAEPMRAYMKSELPFLGVPKPQRQAALQPLLRSRVAPDAATWEAAVRQLWDSASHREERYAATALAQARVYATWSTRPAALPLFEHLITTGAWWDHVDEVAIRSVGPVLRARHDTVAPVVAAWSRDPDRWLRRASVICQIGSKAATDVALLTECVLANADDPDFFLRKGIGWALREHAKTDPEWVRSFVAAHADRLSPLSRREAIRRISDF